MVLVLSTSCYTAVDLRGKIYGMEEKYFVWSKEEKGGEGSKITSTNITRWTRLTHSSTWIVVGFRRQTKERWCLGICQSLVLFFLVIAHRRLRCLLLVRRMPNFRDRLHVSHWALDRLV